MRSIKLLATVALALAAVATAASAQRGPVAASCQNDIAKYCAGKQHGGGEVRSCLEANRDKVTPPCRSALVATGGGR